MDYLKRDLEEPLHRACKQFPAVLVTGPRQAGKSTLLQTCLPGYTYVTLDRPTDRSLARNDPELFLNTYAAPVIIDEIQYAPGLLSYIKIRIDTDRNRVGQYILTGSQVFQLMAGVTESLAGRVAIFELYPLSWRELPDSNFKDPHVMADRIVRGFYPELVGEQDTDIWFESYISTYLERDVRNLQAVSDLNRFQTFFQLLATRVGSLLQLSDIARDCGISHTTARSWISILEATYAIYLLRPYFRNRSKRLVKAPKLYFLDTGLLCHLLGIHTGERFMRAAERGHIFENMVIIEWLKRTQSRRSLYYYRTQKGAEVDLLVDRSDKLLALEIKLTQTPNSPMAEHLQAFIGEHETSAPGYLLSLQERQAPLNRQVQAIHWSDSYEL